jgi:hypothetical protein
MKFSKPKDSDHFLNIQEKFNELETQHENLKKLTKEASGKGRENPTYKRISKLDDLISNWCSLSEKNPHSLIHEKNYEEFKNFVRIRFTENSREELLDAIGTSYAVCYRLKELLGVAEKNFSTLLSIVAESHLQTAKNEHNRTNGKGAKDSADEKRMQESLQATLKELSREPLPEDFPKFVRILKSKYPLPLYVRKPRLTPEEKLLSKDDREMVLKLKFDPNWKESRLRKFWTAHTGLDAKKKKLTTKVMKSKK